MTKDFDGLNDAAKCKIAEVLTKRLMDKIASPDTVILGGLDGVVLYIHKNDVCHFLGVSVDLEALSLCRPNEGETQWTGVFMAKLEREKSALHELFLEAKNGELSC
jgi:hypothetical protein